MVTPEPDLGPPPPLTSSDIRPPEPFVEATDWDSPEPDAVSDSAAPEDEVTELTAEERLLFSRLLTVGQRHKTIDVMGHTVGIQSLRVSDEMRIGLLCRDHSGSKMENRAFQVGVCAAGISAIDGAPIYQSLTGLESVDEMFAKKVDTLKEYYPIVITQIYSAILELDQEFVELSKKLGKLKG